MCAVSNFSFFPFLIFSRFFLSLLQLVRVVCVAIGFGIRVYGLGFRFTFWFRLGWSWLWPLRSCVRCQAASVLFFSLFLFFLIFRVALASLQ